MAKRGPKVAIIVTNYNGASISYRSKPILWHTFASIKNTNYDNLVAIFTDDSSSDNSVAYVKSHFPFAKVTVNKPNGGYTKNVNNGIRYAIKNYNPEYILTLNNDVIIKDRDWLRKMVSAAESNDYYGIIGPKLLYPDGRLQQAGMFMSGPLIRNTGWNTHNASKYNKTEETVSVGGVAQLIKRKVIEKIGLLDENFYQGDDDVDYCLSAAKAGFKIIYVGAAKVIHLEGFTSKKVSSSKGENYWFPIFQINNMYTAFKQYNTIQLCEAIFITMLTAVVGVGSRKLSLTSIRFKDKIPWRLYVSAKAIITAHRLYKGTISREEAYGL